jgi:DNA mismatch endonuclease, patch repair protein
MDIYSAKKRSAIMRSVRTVHTAPEMAVRRVLRKMHVRFIGNSDRLPGRPDVVLPDCHAVLFVHGCFWHHHRACGKAKLPTTNRAFWTDKITENAKRDKRVASELRRAGWKVKVVWECETRRLSLQGRIARLVGVNHAR